MRRLGHPGRLLRQPAALGVARRPHRDDQAVRRPDAGDFSVRGGDLREGRRAGGVRRPSAGRPRRADARPARRCSAPRASTRCRPVVALLPGSRPNELTRDPARRWSDAARAARRSSVPGVQFLVARAPALDDALFAPLERLRAAGVPVAVLDEAADDVLAAADVVVTASGTATVQAALARPADGHRVPPVAADVRHRPAFVRVHTYGMVNLVAGRPIVPELIQDGFTRGGRRARSRWRCSRQRGARRRDAPGAGRRSRAARRARRIGARSGAARSRGVAAAGQDRRSRKPDTRLPLQCTDAIDCRYRHCARLSPSSRFAPTSSCPPSSAKSSATRA